MVTAVSALLPSLAGAASSGTESNPSATRFLDMVNSALQNVSATQNAAASAEQNYAAGAPGASLPKALVASDRAEVAWNATVAVRNEIVSAYQSIMNMQF
jgi:flagellar hook-basal body complex protein FliE